MAGTCWNCVRNCFTSAKIFGRIVSLSILFLILSMAPAGAAAGGSISGSVKDASNAVVPNAKVTAVNSGTGIEQHVVTNDRGFYSFPDLPVGRYDVTIETRRI